MDDGSIGVRFKFFGFIPFTPEEVKDLRFTIVSYDGNQILKLLPGPPVGQKVKDKELPDFVNQYLGDYTLSNPDSWPEGMNVEGLELSNADGYIRAKIKTDGEPQVVFLDVLKDGRAKIIGYGRSKGGSLLFDINDQDVPKVHYSGLIFTKSDGTGSSE